MAVGRGHATQTGVSRSHRFQGESDSLGLFTNHSTLRTKELIALQIQFHFTDMNNVMTAFTFHLSCAHRNTYERYDILSEIDGCVLHRNVLHLG